MASRTVDPNPAIGTSTVSGVCKLASGRFASKRTTPPKSFAFGAEKIGMKRDTL